MMRTGVKGTSCHECASRASFAPVQPLQRLLGQRASLLTKQVCRADRDGDSETDWDAAWRSFQKQVRSTVDVQEPAARQTSVRPLPLKTSQDQLRQQERVLLDLWTSEDALKWGSIAAILGLLTVIVVSGPPLDDGRCTLPWC